MIVKMFKPQFAPLVESGQKLQTIRPTPKRAPKPNEEISLREWTGKPYRSKQRELKRSTITSVTPIYIHMTGIQIDGIEIPEEEMEQLAKDDGFESFHAMWKWFESEHKTRGFKGVLYRWT